MRRRDRRGRQTTTMQPRPFVSLGTDGFGRSDTRSELRRFFEVDEGHVTVAVLSALSQAGAVDPATVQRAITDYEVDTASVDPRLR